MAESLCSPTSNACVIQAIWYCLAFFFFWGLMVERKMLSGESKVLHPRFCCCLSAGEECVSLSRTVPLNCVDLFLVSALFFLFHFGIWVQSSLPTLCSSTSLLKWGRSRTLLLDWACRGMACKCNHVSLFTGSLENTWSILHLFSFEKLTWISLMYFLLFGYLFITFEHLDSSWLE